MPWLLEAADRALVERELLGATRERMLREMAELVEALTAEVPLVLVLEDLHWSDAATIDLISLIARRREPARLLLIGTHRPADARVIERPVKEVQLELESRGKGHELSLALLGEAAVADYLGERFPDSAFPRELARVIHRRTEGNPLFMVTVMDDLLARGLIATRERTWELGAPLEEVELDVPESLRQMIERQISRVGRDEQRILEAGSVVGMEFSAASVAAAIEWKLADVEERLDELAQRQLFLRSHGTREWPDRTVATRYGFVHALHRNTLYQRLSPARRRELHQAIGEREEAGYGDRVRDVAAELAAHFGEAGDDERAVRYLQLAAGTALRRHANREAVGYLARARDIAAGLPEPAGLRRGSGSSSSSVSRAARWATCPPPSTISKPWPAARASTAVAARRSGRCSISPARCPGSTASGASSPASRRSSSRSDWEIPCWRRMSAGTAGSSGFFLAGGGTRTPSPAATRSRSRGGPESGIGSACTSATTPIC